MEKTTGRVFLLGLDNLLQDHNHKGIIAYPPEVMWEDTLTSILLFGDALMPDVWAFTNGELTKKLSEDLGRKILQSGRLGVAMRDKASNFPDVLRQLRGAGAYGLDVPGLDEYAKFLDSNVSTIVPFSFGSVAGNFTNLCDRTITQEVLTSLDLSPTGARVIERMFKTNHVATRTFLVQTLKIKLPMKDRDRFTEIANTIYGLGVPSSLDNCGFSVPPGLASAMDDILNVIHGERYAKGTIGVISGSAKVNFAYSHKITSPEATWLFATIASLTTEEFEVAISGSSRLEYMTAVQQQLRNPSLENWVKFINAFELYFKTVGSEIFHLRTRKKKLQDPHQDASLFVTGDSTIRITSPEKVALVGAIKGDNLLVVGETIGIPVPIII